jgi:adenylate kinase
MGPPGSGKGTLSQLCVQHFGWKQLSTGLLCRKHITEKTEIGQQIDFSIKSGKLVSDSLIIEMVKNWLVNPEQNKSDIILDGFPRNVPQAEALCETLAQMFPFFSIAIFRLFISHEAVLQRLLNRFVCENKDCQAVYSATEVNLQPKVAGRCNLCLMKLIKRSDDQIDTIRDRLETYRIHEDALLSFFEKRGLSIREINVENQLEKIFQQFRHLITGSVL